MILVDTSIWISHFRLGHETLTDLLNAGEVVIHPFIIGELSCGNLPNRKKVIYLLSMIPRAATASDNEALKLLEENSLYGLGLGWVDLHLLASAIISHAKLWTLDKRLAKTAQKLGVAYIKT